MVLFRYSLRLMLLITLSLFFWTSSGHATTLRYLSSDELVSEADSVVHGRVLAVEPRWTDNMSAIYTSITLDVIEVFKGISKKDTLEFTFLGGNLDGVALMYEHQPSFVPDEEVLVFLRKQSDGSHLLMALSQGVWRKKDSSSGDLDPLFIRNVRGIRYSINKTGTIDEFRQDQVKTSYHSAEIRNLVRILSTSSKNDEEVPR